MKTAKRIHLFILCAIAMLSTGAASAAALDAPEEAGLRQVAEHIYVSPEMSGDQVAQAITLVKLARQRVAQFYGEPLARPNILMCATADCYCDFGAVGLGFTDGNTVLISPQGRRVAIIAHELAHVEFAARVGSFAKVLADVPQWFDEGQAVLISQAEEFSEAAWHAATAGGRTAPPLTTLVAIDDWNRLTGAAGEAMQLTYGTARREVDRWFALAGPGGLPALAQALRQGETFADAYARIAVSQHLATALPAADRQTSPMPTAVVPGAPSGSLIRAAW